MAGSRKADRGETGAKEAGWVRWYGPLSLWPLAVRRLALFPHPGLDPVLGLSTREGTQSGKSLFRDDAQFYPAKVSNPATVVLPSNRSWIVP